MNFEFLRTLQGFINLVQVCLGFAALFASSFIWNHTNVYFQFIYNSFGWQTLILFILFITWIFALLIFLSNLFEKDVLGQLGKKKLLILYLICLIALVISASLETWYASKASKDEKNPLKHPFSQAHILKPRFIAVAIFNWILVASYVVLMVITVFFV